MNTMGWQCSSAPADEELSILVYHNHLTSSAHVSSLNSNIQTRSNNIFYQNDKHPTTLLYKSQPSSNTLAKTHARTLLRVHQYLYCAPADGSYFISLFFRRAERVRTSPSCSHTHTMAQRSEILPMRKSLIPRYQGKSAKSESHYFHFKKTELDRERDRDRERVSTGWGKKAQ